MTIATSPNLDGLLLEVLVTPDGQADPYPRYARMRAEARVSRTAFGPYVVNGYQECLGVLRDPRLGRGKGLEGSSTGIFGDQGTRRGEYFEASQHNMLMADPPDHTRLRRLVSRSFTPRQVERLQPAIHRLVDDLLDVMAARGEVDFIAEFALPLPMDVIGELVGVPASERAGLQPLVRAAAKGIEPVLSEEETAASIDAIVHSAEYFTGLLDERRRQPREDLLTRAGAGQRERRPPDRRRDHLDGHPVVLRRLRDDDQPPRQRLAGVAAPPRPAGRLAAPPRVSRRPPSRSCSASTARCSSTSAPPWNRPTCWASRWSAARGSWCSRVQQTGTRRASTGPTTSISAATTTRR